MRRSEVNRILADSLEFCRRWSFSLPPWALWSPDDWLRAGHEYDEVRDCKLGWDVTDFGGGDFAHTGLSVFTIRNGHPFLPAYTKSYCEKLLIVGEGQHTPYHFHFEKTEDIICRAGGDLLVTVCNADDSGGLADTPVAVHSDGRRYEVEARATVRLGPGESITLPSYVYHTFWAEEGKAASLVGEVSKVNDDDRDNRFLEALPRFPEIEEDEPPLHLLCTEYPPACPGWLRKRLGI